MAAFPSSLGMRERDLLDIPKVKWDSEKLGIIGMRTYHIDAGGAVPDGELESIHIRPPGRREIVFEKYNQRGRIKFGTKELTLAGTNVIRRLHDRDLIKYLNDPRIDGYFTILFRGVPDERSLIDYIESIPGIDAGTMDRMGSFEIAYPISMLYLTLQNIEGEEDNWTDGLDIFVRESISVDRETLFNTLRYLLEEQLELVDRTLSVNRLVFGVQGRVVGVYMDNRGRLIINSIHGDTGEEDAIAYLTDLVNRHRILDVSIVFEYKLTPGPFDYIDLLERVNDADSMEVWPAGADPIVFIRDVTDADNEYLAQFGLYDSRKPIPEVDTEGDVEEDSDFVLRIVYYNPADKLMIGG